MVELVMPILAWPMASFDENEEALIQLGELADLRFNVSCIRRNRGGG
jgi:hypothetical protein